MPAETEEPVSEAPRSGRFALAPVDCCFATSTNSILHLPPLNSIAAPAFSVTTFPDDALFLTTSVSYTLLLFWLFDVTSGVIVTMTSASSSMRRWSSGEWDDMAVATMMGPGRPPSRKFALFNLLKARRAGKIDGEPEGNGSRASTRPVKQSTTRGTEMGSLDASAFDISSSNQSASFTAPACQDNRGGDTSHPSLSANKSTTMSLGLKSGSATLHFTPRTDELLEIITNASRARKSTEIGPPSPSPNESGTWISTKGGDPTAVDAAADVKQREREDAMGRTALSGVVGAEIVGSDL
mmetsp:Transcript_6044/g.11479  ORF Transcript_6044/g.11479 Transcript_6044/m.11479 type:complete len:297 (+) Transcript_6044:228-1118(+)